MQRISTIKKQYRAPFREASYQGWRCIVDASGLVVVFGASEKIAKDMLPKLNS